MTFTDPLVDGNGGLVVPLVKSPNFVHGVSGWAIFRDGSAEFNDIGARGTVILSGPNKELLVYGSSPPAAGNLILAVAPAAGLDAFGNGFGQGLTISTWPGFPIQKLTFFDQGTEKAFLEFNSLLSSLLLTSDVGNSMVLQAGHVGLKGNGNNGDFVAISNADFIVGSGPTGQYYASDGTFTQLAVVTGTPTQVSNYTKITEMSDYANPWAPGVTFTAPVNGFYDTSLYLVNNISSAQFMRAVIRKNGINVCGNNGVNGGDACAAYPSLWMFATDVLSFVVRHTAGVNTDLSGRISVARRL